MKPRKTRLYVGLNATLSQLREVFRAEPTPSKETHPQYGAVIGPFRTRAGAEFMARFGYNNPHVLCVADAERLAKAHKPGLIGYDGKSFSVGDRVELHPGMDLWMRGAKYGTVHSVSLTPNDRVKVRMDHPQVSNLVAGPADRFRKV